MIAGAPDLVNEVGKPGMDRPDSKRSPSRSPAAQGAEAQSAENSCRGGSIADGVNILVLSDRGLDREHAPIPALLAVSGLHHHLIRQGTRTRAGLVLESGEPREVHHFSLLIGYGCSAINPYLAFETLDDMIRDSRLTGIDHTKAVEKYIKAAVKGVVKTMAKMGISTIQSYRGAQIFEAIGLNHDVVNRYFTWTASRVEGVGLDVLAEEALARHRQAFEDAKSTPGARSRRPAPVAPRANYPSIRRRFTNSNSRATRQTSRPSRILCSVITSRKFLQRAACWISMGERSIPLDEVESVERS